MSMQFAKLTEVDLRDAWPNEARDFTPWLADNLDRLSQAIGIPMELEGAEVSVEQFSADILARIPADNSLVLIENQLENTDHTHLGQILTYLAGLETQTVIWIARGFQEPHLSAIRWLNQHTADPFAFFAVRVKVVRIGDDVSAPVAPLFEVLERPSQWDRQVHASQQRSDSDEIRKFRQDFWGFYTIKYPGDIRLREGFKNSNVYHQIAGLVVSQYVAQKQVGIYLRAPDGDSSAESSRRLQHCHAALSKDGMRPDNDMELDLEDQLSLPQPRHYAVRQLAIDYHDRANWPRISEWLHGNLREYRSVLSAEEPETDSTEN